MRDTHGADDEAQDDRTKTAHAKFGYRVKRNQNPSNRFTIGVTRLTLYWRAVRRMASACVGYGWITVDNVDNPSLATIARVTSLIISPACRATIVAPRISSVPRLV